MKFRIVYNAWWMRKGWAVTIWPWVWVGLDKSEFTERHFRHELEHCYQVNRMGRLRFYVTYLLKLFNYGYKKHPYEVEARARQYDPLTEVERYWYRTGRIGL